MAWFEGTYTETRAIAASPATVLAHFADPAAILAQTKNLESSHVDGDVIHFVIKEEDHGVVKFKADYRCRYTTDGERVTWTAVDGNLLQSGEARVEADGAGSKLTYTETLKIDLGVPAMMAPMLAGEAKEYVKRMVAALG